MHNVQDKLFIFFIGLLISLASYGQKITVKGGFVQDSVRIGENIDYWLTASYPESIDLILPDTLYSFSPWEFSSKSYYPSRLVDGIVYDSAVYTLQSYEIDQIQYLSLPAMIVNSIDDTVKVLGNKDSIFFSTSLPLEADTLKLKKNLAYQNVETKINFPLIWIISGVLLLLIIIGLLVFGKKLQQMYKLKKLKKEYINFSEQLTQNIRSLKDAPDQLLAEITLTHWKVFLEKMEKKPFTKLTTKEIMYLDYTNELNGTLKNIDRCIYGGFFDQNLYKDFQAIEDFTQHRYTVITDQIKNS